VFGTITFRNLRTRSRECAIAEVQSFLEEIQAASRKEMGWTIAASLGAEGGRFHCHVLVGGLSHSDIPILKAEASDRFGDAMFDQYDESLGGAHYLAKNALADGGDLRFGGRFFDKPESEPVGRYVIPGAGTTAEAATGTGHGIRVFLGAQGRKGSLPGFYCWSIPTLGLEKTETLGRTRTLTEALLVGLISALKMVPDHEEVEVLCDSEPVCEVINGEAPHIHDRRLARLLARIAVEIHSKNLVVRTSWRPDLGSGGMPAL